MDSKLSDSILSMFWLSFSTYKWLRVLIFVSCLFFSGDSPSDNISVFWLQERRWSGVSMTFRFFYNFFWDSSFFDLIFFTFFIYFTLFILFLLWDLILPFIAIFFSDTFFFDLEDFYFDLDLDLDLDLDRFFFLSLLPSLSSFSAILGYISIYAGFETITVG